MLAGDQLPAHVVAMDGGEIAVQHHHVVRVDGGLLQRLGAVEGEVDGEAVAPQPARDRARKVALVLDQQHAHAASGGASIPRAGYAARPNGNVTPTRRR